MTEQIELPEEDRTLIFAMRKAVQSSGDYVSLKTRALKRLLDLIDAGNSDDDHKPSLNSGEDA